MGVRHLWRLIEWLPLDSPLARSYDPDGIGSGWTPEADLLALVAEVADVNNVLLLHINSKEGTKIRDPIKVRRRRKSSKDDDGKPKMASGTEMEAFARAHGARVKSKGKKVKTSGDRSDVQRVDHPSGDHGAGKKARATGAPKRAGRRTGGQDKRPVARQPVPADDRDG